MSFGFSSRTFMLSLLCCGSVRQMGQEQAAHQLPLGKALLMQGKILLL